MKTPKTTPSAAPATNFNPHFVVAFKLLYGILVFVLFGCMCYQLFVTDDYWLAVNQSIRSKPQTILAKRGDILSSDGQILSTTLPEYELWLQAHLIDKTHPETVAQQQSIADSIVANAAAMDSLCHGLRRIIPDFDISRFRSEYARARHTKPYNFRIHPRRVSYLQLEQIRRLPLLRLGAKGGFSTLEFQRRKAPYGQMAIRTIGRLHRANDAPETGLELGLDSLLRGTNGLKHIERLGGRNVDFVDLPPIDGLNLHTTLDVRMQDIVEKTLRAGLYQSEALKGVCILMDVPTGDVKAISSLQLLGDKLSYAETENSALRDLYEPGSVFKTASIMVALDEGKISMSSGVDTKTGVKKMYGRMMKDSNWRTGGHGYLDLLGAIQTSSNIAISTLIDDAYKHNPDAFVDGIDRLGLTEDPHLPLVGYRLAVVRHRRDDPTKWYKTTLPWMSVGYETNVPPLITLTFYNAIANGGRMMAPRFVTHTSREGETEREFPTRLMREHICKDATLHNVQRCLEAVLDRHHGTGKAAYTPHFPIAGKTGTSQIWEKKKKTDKYMVSFVGYFPANAPRYSMIVCMVKAGRASGGGDCGPVFRRVAETIMALAPQNDYRSARDSSALLREPPYMAAGNLRSLSGVLRSLRFQPNEQFDRRAQNPWGTAVWEESVRLQAEAPRNTMPDLTGYSLRDALYRLERMGLRVQHEGFGRVWSQSLPEGTPLRRGLVVGLRLSPKGQPPRHAHHSEALSAQRAVAPALPLSAPPKSTSEPASNSSELKSKSSEQKSKNSEALSAPAVRPQSPASSASSTANKAEKRADKDKGKADKSEKRADKDKGKADKSEKRADKDKGKADKSEKRADKDKGKADKAEKRADKDKGKADKAEKRADKDKGKADKSEKRADKDKGKADKSEKRTDKDKGKADKSEKRTDKDKGKADKDKGKADKAEKRADKDKGKADKAEKRADKDKGKADKDKGKADKSEKRADKDKGKADKTSAKTHKA